MSPQYLSPGVYIEEVDRGSRPIEAAGTFAPATATEAAPEAAPCPDEKVPESFMPAPNATP